MEEFCFFCWCFVMMDCADWVSWCVCFWECCVVTSRVAHRFRAISTKALIRHLAFSLEQYYPLCELPLPNPVIGGSGKCVCVLSCLPKFSCFCLFKILFPFPHQYAGVYDCIKSVMFSLSVKHRCTQLCICVCTHTYVHKAWKDRLCEARFVGNNAQILIIKGL